jgi:tetratricopeptide (TPR) repeat protein
MSRVFVAEETGLGRKVVVKVLPPELAAGVNVDRFRREIQLAASLQHPHIVPLHAAGQADGLLYFTMPLVEGDSLRARLARAGEQPVADTVRLLRDVVDALAYAHARGVVHRDIKPDNILLSAHHAMVTDFGVAKALSESTGRAALTSAGVALGTPAYMAPEQAAADPHADHRIDIYAVGAVAYEMLTGSPPFTGPTPQAVLAAHMTKPPEPIAAVRPAVPTALVTVVMRCLEKKPADRWQTAEELLQQLEAVATSSGGTPPTELSPARRKRSLLLGGALVATILLAVGLILSKRPRPAAAPPDPNLVAVFPFRVTGAGPALAHLREGMVELLAVKLTGEGGARAIDPTTSLSAWRRASGPRQEDLDQETALAIARRLGAGRIIEGSVVGSPDRLVLAGTVAGAGERSSPVSVEGPLDSLSVLVDRLTAGLLAGREGAGHLAELTSASLPALRAYLDGRAAYRRGNYRESVRHFEHALQADSTFALAGLYLQQAAGWCCDVGSRGFQRAWAGKDRLSPADRALLNAAAGPRYPDRSPSSEHLKAWEEAVSAAPDRAEAWYGLGDILFHQGRVLGVTGSWERGIAAFHRSLELDSSFAGPLQHLVEAAAVAGDSASARRYASLALAGNSSSEVGDYLRWRVAMVAGDTAELKRLRSRFADWTDQSLGSLIYIGQQDGIGIEDVQRAIEARQARASTRSERAEALGLTWVLAMNRGRPAEGLRASRAFGEVQAFPNLDLDMQVYGAIYWDGDTAAAAAAARRMALSADASPASREDARATQYGDACTVAQWRLYHGRTEGVDRSLALLLGTNRRRDPADVVSSATTCAAMLKAWRGSISGDADAAAAIERLDSLLLTGPPGWSTTQYGNLLLARLLESRGETSRALGALRRRRYFMGPAVYLSSYLRDEGRLAALTGDRDGAIRAYQHYLALRRQPESELRPQVDQVKAELAKLLAER